VSTGAVSAGVVSASGMTSGNSLRYLVTK
jgi:hypothetical protein